MKELSIEEKTKRYDKALVIAKSRYSIETEESVRICLELMFPELKESEDEKIRKGLIALIKECLIPPTLFRFGLNKEDTVAWLEKQGEQKPSDEQIDALEDAIADAVSSIQKNMLNSLYNDLKKLKG